METFTITNDVDFLLNHSNNILKCSECNKEDEQITEQEFFSDYYKKILLDIKREKYSSYEEEKRRRKFIK